MQTERPVLSTLPPFERSATSGGKGSNRSSDATQRLSAHVAAPELPVWDQRLWAILKWLRSGALAWNAIGCAHGGQIENLLLLASRAAADYETHLI
jgi:hypothetical protein